jgi:hypothetical protein
VHDGQKVEMNFISKQLHMKYPVVVSIGIIQKESSFKYDGINLKKMVSFLSAVDFKLTSRNEI